MGNPKLSEDLATVQRIFDIPQILRGSNGKDTTVDYYTQSERGYRRFHSADGSVHMALNYDGVFNEAGYYEQARIVSRQIVEKSAQKVLELGSGKGANSLFLAPRHPEVQFTGVDLTPVHVAIAQKQAKALQNLSFQLGNFQNLPFQPETFDLIFEVESLCHATDMAIALTEIYRVLKPGGRLVIIDGFREPNFQHFDADLQTAARLVETCMAVPQGFLEIQDWLAIAREVGFDILETQNFSEAVLPTMIRLQALAQKYFRKPFMAHCLKLILPPHLIKNAIAGLLMPSTVQLGAHSYYMIVLERGY